MNITVNSTADKARGALNTGEMTLRAAIEAANTERNQEVVIDFDPAVFNEPKTIHAPNTSTAFLISGNVRIIGPESELTIRGQGLGPVFWIDSGTFPQYPNKGDGTSGSTPIVVPGTDKKVTIKNLHITGGKKYGGILSSENLILENVKIYANKANFDAAKATEKFPWGDPTQDRPFPYIPNRFPAGAGVTSVNGDLTILNSEIFDNTGRNARGGGVLAYQIAETLSIVKNQSVNITGSKIFGNSISIQTPLDPKQLLADQPNGGGVLSLADYTNIDNTAIFDNESTYGGGGLATAANGRGLTLGEVEIANSTIYGNTAEVRGGGLLGMMNLSGSTVNDNKASKQPDLSDVAGGYFAIELDAEPNTPGEQKMIHFIAGGENLAMTSAGFNIIGDAGQKNRANSATSSILPVLYDPTQAPLLVAIPTSPLTSNFWPHPGERPDAVDTFGHAEQPLEALGVETQKDAEGIQIGLEPSSQLIDAGDPNLTLDPNERDANGNPRQKGLVVDVGGVEFASEVALTSDRPQMEEGETTTFTVSRDPVDLGDLTVGLRLKTTAQPTDFVLQLAGGEAIAPNAEGLFTVTIPDGETAIAFEVVAIEDNEKEIREYFGFELLPSVLYETVQGAEQLESELKYSDLTPGTVVTNTNDDGEGSLREAIRIANETPGDDVIVFDFEDPNLGDQTTITLTSGSLTITDGVFIHGPRDQQVTIARDLINAAHFRIFTIDDGDSSINQNVKLENLTITQGFAGDRGGGIYNAENLAIVKSQILENKSQILENMVIPSNAVAKGGGIYNLGSLKIDLSEISDNQVQNSIKPEDGDGGGIANDGTQSVFKMTRTTLANNQASGSGGGIYHKAGMGTIINSTISGNTAAGEFGAVTYENRLLPETPGGGGIFNEAELDIYNSTIARNQANAFGGGLAQSGDINDTNPTGYTKLSSTIIAENQSIFSDAYADVGGNIHNPIQSNGNNVIGIGDGFSPAFLIQRPETGHYYQVVYDPSIITWEEAKLAAEEKGGYLATPTTEEENNFISSLLLEVDQLWRRELPGTGWTDGNVFIGGFKPENNIETEADQGWEWVNDEGAFTDTSWHDGQGGRHVTNVQEPSNSGGGEDFIHYFLQTKNWNDGPKLSPHFSYVIEYEKLEDIKDLDLGAYSPNTSDQVGSVYQPHAVNLGDLQDGPFGSKTHPLQVSSSAIDQGSNPLGLATDQLGGEFPRQIGDGVDIGAREFGNEGPIANPDLSELQLRNPGQVRQGNTLSNDISPMGDDLTVIAVNNDVNNINQFTDTFSTDLDKIPMGLVRVDEDGDYYFDPNGDFEFLDEGEETQVEFTYTIADESNNTDTATVTINIRGNNDAPTDIVLNEIGTDTGIVAIAEPSVPGSDTTWMVKNQPDGFIGWLNALDPDQGDNENFANFTFEISLPTTDTVLFEIQRDPTTQKSYLKLKANANINTSKNTVHHNLAITATDSAGLKTTEVFSFAIVDPAKIGLNYPPTSTPTNFSLDENTTYFFKPTDFPFQDRNPGDTLKSIEIIGRPTQGELILATDLGSGQIDKIRAVGLGERISVEQLTGGSSAEKLAFRPYPNEHGIVSDTEPNRAPYDGFLFRVSDGKDVSQMEYLAIAHVFPVNTPPTVLPDQEFTIPRDLPINAPVGTIVGQDWDGGTTMSDWAIDPASNPDVDGDGTPAFSINSETGEITLTDPDDLANEITQITLDVTVQDEEFTSAVQSVTIYIKDAPPNNFPITEDYEISISNEQIYYFNGDEFSFKDLDPADTFHAVQITQWPALGDLFIDRNGDGIFDPSEKAPFNTDIPATEINQLKFVPDPLTGSGGYSTEMGFIVSDGKGYSQPAKITITVGGSTIVPTPKPITGSWKSDTLVGTDQDDIIQGNQGKDILTGGAGNDIFRYACALDFADVITDFEVGRDRIDLSAVLAEIGYTGSDPLGDGYVTMKTTPLGKTYLQLDVDGTGSLPAIDIAEVVGVGAIALNNASHFIF
jgi:CSLREA domain-containing protein